MVEDTQYLAAADLERGGIYRVKSRNLRVAAFNGDEGFIGVRLKFSERYLFTEYLARECGGTQVPFDTVYPIQRIASVPGDVPLVELMGLWCLGCDRPAHQNDEPYPDRRAWCDGGCPKDKRDIRWRQNDALFGILSPLDEDEQRKEEERWPRLKLS